MEFFTLFNVILILMAVYFTLNTISLASISRYNFSSIVRLVLVFFFIGVFLTGIVIATNEHKYRTEGAVLYAQVSDFSSRITSEIFNDVEYTAKYSFVGKHGGSYSSTATLSQYEWELLKTLPDPKVKIVYLESNPEKSKLESQDDYYLGCFMALFGIIGAVGTLLKKRKIIYNVSTESFATNASGVNYKPKDPDEPNS